MHRRHPVFLLIVLASCSKQAKEPEVASPASDKPIEPAVEPASCRTATLHAVDLFNEEYPDGPKIPNATIEKEILRCEQASLSAEVIACMMAATGSRAYADCEQEPVRSTKSEAELNLDAIKKGVKSRLADLAGFVAGSEELTPAESCCDSGRADRKCEVDMSLWTSGDPDAPWVWDEISFAIEEPHYFQYAYEGTDESFTAIAVGDLDCDDTFVTYTLTGDYNNGNPEYTLTKPARAD